MPKGRTAAKSVVRSVNTGKDSPLDTAWLMTRNVSTAMIGGMATFEIAVAHLRLSRSASAMSPSYTAVLLKSKRLEFSGLL